MSNNSHIKRKILIIEDDKSLCTLLTAALKDEDFDILIAEDGKVGLKTAREQIPDLILLDLEMPGMKGLEVLKELRAYEKTRDIRVIILTNSSDVSSIEEAMEGSVFTYLTKSDWELEDIIKKVKEALDMLAPN
ncbi:response regulator [Patescibacteria group bacterium]|nr:response regulator [Patescibacteria group bacterium]